MASSSSHIPGETEESTVDLTITQDSEHVKIVQDKSEEETHVYHEDTTRNKEKDNAVGPSDSDDVLDLDDKNEGSNIQDSEGDQTSDLHEKMTNYKGKAKAVELSSDVPDGKDLDIELALILGGRLVELVDYTTRFRSTEEFKMVFQLMELKRDLSTCEFEAIGPLVTKAIDCILEKYPSAVAKVKKEKDKKYISSLNDALTNVEHRRAYNKFYNISLHLEEALRLNEIWKRNAMIKEAQKEVTALEKQIQDLVDFPSDQNMSRDQTVQEEGNAAVGWEKGTVRGQEEQAEDARTTLGSRAVAAVTAFLFCCSARD